MPIEAKCPYVAEWSGFSDEGVIIERTIGPEDILPYIVDGYTIAEISKKTNAPVEAVTHAVAVIGDMMKWREMLSTGYNVDPDEHNMLTDIQRELIHQRHQEESQNDIYTAVYPTENESTLLKQK